MELKKLSLDGEGFWYLATPYSKYAAGLEFGFTHACHAAGQLLAAGVHVYSPIAHTHPVAMHGGLDPLAHEMFLPLDEQIMKHAYGALVVKMPGWNASKGVTHEIEFFRREKKPVVFLTWAPALGIENPEALEDFEHEGDDAEAHRRFLDRYQRDGAQHYTKERWDEWVNALPTDEFMAMISLGTANPKAA